MNSRASMIGLGNGYQTVQGAAVESVAKDEVFRDKARLDSMVKRSPPTPKFLSSAKFYESNAAIQQELSMAFGLGANLHYISPEVDASFSTISSNHNSVSYYLIRFEWEKYSESLDLTDSTNFINLYEAMEDAELFYNQYGNKIISRVTYGEKLIAVVEINKAKQAKASKYLAAADVSAQAAIKASFEISELLDSLFETDTSNIYMYSIGSNKPQLQIVMLDNLKDLKDKLADFMQMGRVKPSPPRPLEPCHSPPACEPDNRYGNNRDKNQWDQRVEACSRPVSRQTCLNLDAPPECAPEDPKTEQNYNVIISFTSCSYTTLLPKTNRAVQIAALNRYNQLLIATSRASAYLKQISLCLQRTELFLEDVRYALEKQSPFRYGRSITDSIQADFQKLLKVKNNTRWLGKHIIENLFKDQLPALNGSMKDWQSKWTEIKSISDLLDNYASAAIDFKNTKFLIGEFVSTFCNTHTSFPFYDRHLFVRHSSEWQRLEIPFETKRIHFDVVTKKVPEKRRSLSSPADSAQHIPAQPPSLHDAQVTFDLIRRHHLQVARDGKAVHILHHQLSDGRSEEPLFPALFHRNVMNDKYNSRTYKKVAIANPLINGFVPEEGETFTVKIFAQTGEFVPPIDTSSSAPEGTTQCQPYTNAIGGDVDNYPGTNEKQPNSQGLFSNSPMSTRPAYNRLVSIQRRTGSNPATPLTLARTLTQPATSGRVSEMGFKPRAAHAPSMLESVLQHNLAHQHASLPNSPLNFRRDLMRTRAVLEANEPTATLDTSRLVQHEMAQRNSVSPLSIQEEVDARRTEGSRLRRSSFDATSIMPAP